MTGRRCGDCDFYQRTGTGEWGECRFDPPRVFDADRTAEGMGSGVAAWPEIRQDQWCAKFVRRMDPAPELQQDDRWCNALLPLSGREYELCNLPVGHDPPHEYGTRIRS